MTATYSGNPSASDKDAVRYLVGDTNVSSAKVTDEEIAFTLVEQPNVYRAAALVARSLAAKYSSAVNMSLDGASISAGSRAQNYLTLAENLERQARKSATFAILPYAGGLSFAEQETNELDTDLKQPAFTREMMHFNPSDPGDEEDNA